MSILFLDFETASELDLTVHGHQNYVEHPSTKVLMLGWALDENPVQIWEPHLGPMPSMLQLFLADPKVKKAAFNASFERLIFKYLLKQDTPLVQWLDIMIWTRFMSIPYGLDDCCDILQIAGEEKKLDGKRLKEMFCMPAVAGKTGTLFEELEKPWYRDWTTHPTEWEDFKEYCRGDIRSARAILRKLGRFRLPEAQQRGWVLDQQMNERGMPVHMPLVLGAISVAERAKMEQKAEATRITQLENVNSDPQMLKWLGGHGYTFGSMAKPIVKRALAGECALDTDAKRVLELRKQFKRTSDAKLHTIRLVISPDGYLRHQFSYMGAARTGRWSGHEVQLQNLPLPVPLVAKNMDRALELLTAADYDAVVREFQNPMDVVASCIRGVIQAPVGKKLVVSDLNAIENRVLGWAADCQAILDVFRQKRDPYIAFAVYLYKKSYEELYHEYKVLGIKDKRQMAKPAVLGAGYRLGGGDERLNKDDDLIKTGLWGYAAAMGILMTREEAHNAVRIFREAFPEVVQFWYDLENAALDAIRTRLPQAVGPFVFEIFEDFVLRIMLPSGRGLHYLYPEIEVRDFYGKPKDTLTYMGIDQETKQWTRIPTHGGKLTENIIQALSRDILLYGLFLAEDAGFELLGTVHDEIISMVEEWSPLDHHDLEDCMSITPEWTPGLPLGAEGWMGRYYRKG